MSYPPTNNPPWLPYPASDVTNDDKVFAQASTSGTGYPVANAPNYTMDLSQVPMQGGMSTADPYSQPQSGTQNPMFDYYGSSGAPTYGNTYCQSQSFGAFPDPAQMGYYPGYGTGTQGPDHAGEGSSKKEGKKRPPRQYTAEQLTKRREQNRKSQRAYRDRKEKRIKELEIELAATCQENDAISSAIDALRAEYESLISADPGPNADSESYDAHPLSSTF